MNYQKIIEKIRQEVIQIKDQESVAQYIPALADS